MGAEVCRAVSGAHDLQLVAVVDPMAAGQTIERLSVAERPSAIAGDVDVAVDFTHAEAARENLVWCADNRVHAVVGTTGFSDSDHHAFVAAFTRSNAVIAANFAIGAVLMMRFAELAAPFFETAEIIELHHDAKVDAPSGTAVATAERMALARQDKPWAPDPTTVEVYPGARGGSGPGGTRIHSVRMRGVVANQEVVLGTTGQTLTLRHDTTDRTSFMPGVLLAIRQVATRPGVTRGLDALLGL